MNRKALSSVVVLIMLIAVIVAVSITAAVWIMLTFTMENVDYAIEVPRYDNATHVTLTLVCVGRDPRAEFELDQKLPLPLTIEGSDFNGTQFILTVHYYQFQPENQIVGGRNITYDGEGWIDLGVKEYPIITVIGD